MPNVDWSPQSQQVTSQNDRLLLTRLLVVGTLFVAIFVQSLTWFVVAIARMRGSSDLDPAFWALTYTFPLILVGYLACLFTSRGAVLVAVVVAVVLAVEGVVIGVQVGMAGYEWSVGDLVLGAVLFGIPAWLLMVDAAVMWRGIITGFYVRPDPTRLGRSGMRCGRCDRLLSPYWRSCLHCHASFGEYPPVQQADPMNGSR